MHTGLVALQHVGSSWTRARTRVPCIGRWILNHSATREVPVRWFFYSTELELRSLGGILHLDELIWRVQNSFSDRSEAMIVISGSLGSVGTVDGMPCHDLFGMVISGYLELL